MPTGPKGEKRPVDPIEQAVMIGRIATGEAEEEVVDLAKRKAGIEGAKARAKAVSAARRSEIAKEGAARRWN